MSTITVTNIKATGETASRAVSGVAAAWVSWNFASVDDSNNISSVSDDGTGLFTTSFTSNMSNALYAESGITRNYHINSSGNDLKTSSGDQHLSFYVSNTSGARTAIDNNRAFIVYHGDLA